jgi:hypothetical protein
LGFLTAVAWLVGPVVVVSYYFTLAYYVAGVVGVLVDYVKLVDGVVLVAHDVFVFNHPLCAGAVKYPAHYRLALAPGAPVCARAVHGKNPLYKDLMLDYIICRTGIRVRLDKRVLIHIIHVIVYGKEQRRVSN